MAKIDGGAVIWARQTEDSEVFTDKPHVWFKIWFMLVGRAKWKKEGRVERGQCHMKYEWLQDKTKATRSQIDWFFRWAKKSGMCTTQKTTRGMIVTLCKYDYYQDLNNYEHDTPHDTDTIQTRHRHDTIQKKDKKEKKEKNKTPYSEFVFLTEKEYEKLIADFGKENVTWMIEKLDNYIGSAPKKRNKYTDHNRVLRGWVLERLQETKGRDHPLKGKISNIEAYETIKNAELD